MDSPSCTKAIIINFKDTIIKLRQNRQITVNGDEIIKFPILINGARIRIASSIFLVINLPNNLEVWWDGMSRVYINAPAKLHGKFTLFNLHHLHYLIYLRSFTLIHLHSYDRLLFFRNISN